MINKVLFIAFSLLLCSNSLNAQSRIGKKEQHLIRETCEVYQRQSRLLITDFEAPDDSIKSVSTEALFAYRIILRDFYERMQYDLVFDEEKIIELELKDSIGCIVQTDKRIFKINVKKESDSWRVSGFENHEIDQADIDSLRVDIDRRFEEEAVKDSIKEIAQEFVNGWSEMRQTGESHILKSQSTQLFHDYFQKYIQYEHLQGYGYTAMDIEEMGRVSIHGDTAECRVRVSNLGSAYLTFLFTKKQWKVAGLNNEVYTPEDVRRIEIRISDFQELAKFDDYIDEFNSKLEPFFKTGNSSPLKEIATDNMLAQLEIHRRLFGTLDTSFLGVRGIHGYSFPSSNYQIYGDSAYYDYHNDSLRFIKVNGKWMFDEFYVGSKIDNKYFRAHENFREFNQLIRLSYTYYNSLDEYTPLPPGPAAVTPSEEEYATTKNYHRLMKYIQEVTYASGNEQLQKDLDSLVKKYGSNLSFTGTIYVEFDVDNFGVVHNVRTLDQTESEQAEIAMKIVEELGNWLPNDNRQASLTNMVIPIQF